MKKEKGEKFVMYRAKKEGVITIIVIHTIGSSFMSEEKCHLRHIPTNMYLRVHNNEV